MSAEVGWRSYQILLENISIQVKDKRVIENSQHGFPKGEIALNQPDNLLWMTCLLAE